MFIKVSKSKNYSYVQIVSSYRDEDVVKHKLVANLGRFDSVVGNDTLIKLANKLLAVTGVGANKSVKTLSIKEIDRFCYGDIIFKKVWDKLKIDEILLKLAQNRKIKYPLTLVTYLMVISRLIKPRSKHSLYLNQKNYINIANVELQNLYRALDILADGKEEIEEYLFEKQKTLFNLDVDIVFYDVTTFHFESQDADILRDFGFSKANKVNEVQIVFGLIIDKEGRPIGYNIFKGNTYEGKTMEKVLEKLKNRFSINKVIIVADKGLNNSDNFYQITNKGYNYIISSKIKTFKRSLQERILDSEGYISIKNEEHEELYRYKVIENHIGESKDENGKKQKHENKLIITWSKKRSIADKKKRERQIEKAKARVQKNEPPINKKGANKYLKTEGKINVSGIDEGKILEDSKWDGYYGIETSETNITPQTVISNYHMLWKIEESFRILKSTFETRPIFHWTPKRIEGHFVICFLSFLLERNLEIMLRKESIEFSTEKIKEAINSLEVSEVEIEGERFYLKSKSKQLGNQILNKLHIRHPKNLTPKDEFQI